MDDLLLDSSYLFPIFGVGLDFRDFTTIFPKLTERYVMKYNPLSLVEAKWYVLRQIKKKKAGEDLLQSYRRGLLSLERDQKLESTQVTNEKIEEISDSLLAEYSIQDYFDRLIYSTAAYLGSALMTEDDSLFELFKKSSGDIASPKKIMRWKDLLVRENA
jgi:hypothetical protein